jgi:hypothetical protein
MPKGYNAPYRFRHTKRLTSLVFFWNCEKQPCASAGHRKGVAMAAGSENWVQASSRSKGLARLPILHVHTINAAFPVPVAQHKFAKALEPAQSDCAHGDATGRNAP